MSRGLVDGSSTVWSPEFGEWSLEAGDVSAWRSLKWATLRRFHLHDDSNQQPAAAEWEETPVCHSPAVTSHSFRCDFQNKTHPKEHAGFEYCELPK